MSSTFSFSITHVTTQSSLASGARNDAAENVLRKFLNPALKGPGWDAIIAGLAAGDRINWDNAKLAFDQLFLSTASDTYLDKRAADNGQKRPEDVGMSDELFRQLAIATKTHQLTQEAILEVLEVFYGSEAVRAFSTSTMSEPYALADQDELFVLLDEREAVRVVLNRKHFAKLAEAKAVEVAAAISRALKAAGSQAYAFAYKDPTTDETSVRIYSGSRGLGSSVRIAGGAAQRVLKFPDPIFDDDDFSATSWDVDASPDTPGWARFFGGETFDLDQVVPGDLVYIYSNDPTDGFVAADIQGTFVIKNVLTYYPVLTPLGPREQYFEIELFNAPTVTVSQTSPLSLMFFRPTKRTVYDEPRHVIVGQSDEQCDVLIPATTQAVVRGPGTGAYLKVSDALEVESLVRTPGNIVTIETSDPHGLAEGDQVIIDGVLPTGTAPSVTAGTPSEDFS